MATHPTTARRRLLSGALLALLLAGTAVTVAVWRSDATLSGRAEDLQDGSAWLLDLRHQQADLVDGASVAVIHRVDLTGLTAVVQSGADAYATLAGGLVQRVDGATFETGPRVPFVPAGRAAGGDERLEIYPTPSRVFVLNRATGLNSGADPRTLRPDRAVPIAAPATMPEAGAVVDEGAAADGLARMWAVDGTGGLVRIDADGSRTWPRAFTDPGRTRLVDAGGQPVAVDLATGEIRPIGPDGLGGRGQCVQRQADVSAVDVVGAPDARQVYVVDARTGLLLISDLNAGTCTDAVAVTRPGDDLGPPRAAAGRVFIPDRSTGEVIVVDVAGRRVVSQAKVLDNPSSLLELVASGSLMFYNDPGSDMAGVIGPDGVTRTVHKDSRTQPGGQVSSGQVGPAAPPANQPGNAPANQPVSPPAAARSSAPGRAPSPRPRPTQPSAAATAPQLSPVQIAVSSNVAYVGSSLRLRVEPAPGSGVKVTGAQWDFGDGATGGGVDVGHMWSAPGSYTVGVTAVLAGGGYAQTRTNVTVRPAQSAPTPPPTTAPATEPVGQPNRSVAIVSGLGCTSAHCTVYQVSSTGTAALKISGITVTGNVDLATDQCTGRTLAPGSSCLFEIGHTPDPTNSVQIHDNGPGDGVTIYSGTARETPSPAPPTSQPPTTPPATTPPATTPPATPPPATTPPATTPPATTPPATTPPATTPPATSPPPPPTTHTEVATNTGSGTFKNYSNASGDGQRIAVHQAVEVSCRVQGFKVESGDTWWYKIASSPWNGEYYAPADNFYNNGATSGPDNAVFVDASVPGC
ncbi:PKD domain-containing protein [Frankia sp. AgB1.9]|uniref:PKD domain-containing protein n=1 Tax=unclassified Frankia TaxID=2632575 RepID=UPI001932F48F|nr:MULTISPECIES: PKD domain-containing protein [unclassified Frankia]MBL7491247.1 PKD domain-containing protein [Frankia sp. AgW1.1]MBL7551761.1 PKD domain-containing protein [Frankia sp. AgB1.9]MBL7618386.1 PKD domain-containing protein [Frankia sp. AgB1.8]